jgi:uncharacterized protein RhaS with RHS repeats
MKKKLYICIPVVLLLLAGYLFSSPGPEYETISVLTGMETTYISHEDEADNHTTLELLKYDKNGNHVESRVYHSGQLGYLDYYSYDRRGNETHKATIIYENWLPRLWSREEKSYDENNNLTLHVIYAPWKEEQRIIYSYDEDGNLIRKETRKTSGNTTVDIYLYDENGNMIAEGNETSHGTDYSTLYFYDEAGNHVRSEFYNYSGELYQYYVKVFDSLGRITFSAEHDENGEITKFWEFTYDDEKGAITQNCFNEAFYVFYMDDQDRVIRCDFLNAEWELNSCDRYFYEDIIISKK